MGIDAYLGGVGPLTDRAVRDSGVPSAADDAPALGGRSPCYRLGAPHTVAVTTKTRRVKAGRSMVRSSAEPIVEAWP